MVKEYIAPVGEELYSVNTGDWRTERPVIDYDKCKPCGICLINCPVNSIRLVDEEYRIDLSFCKGCSICAYECPQDAIAMAKEDKR